MNFSRASEIFIFITLVGAAMPSAIPMWEFLSRGEKMSKLFNMFVKQVSDHCSSSPMPDCQKALLVYGLTNLAKMEDESLDKMDPYQRGANDIIWDSMMGGHYKRPDTSDHTHVLGGENSLGSGSSGNEEGTAASSEKVETFEGASYVVGPMVVRVMPDGSPIPHPQPLPKDEDAQEYNPSPSLPMRITQNVMQGNTGLQHIQLHAQQLSHQLQQPRNNRGAVQHPTQILPAPLGFQSFIPIAGDSPQ